jgi:hypothetical protein
MSTIDTCFIAANFDGNNETNAPSNRYLSRYEFLEVLVRISDEKYCKSQICKSIPEALGHLLNDNLFKYSGFVVEQQSFREEELWNINNDDLYHANMENIKLCYNVSLFLTYR